MKAQQQTLTPVEILIAPYVSTGLSNKQIAQEIHRSPTTVKGHVENLMHKFGVANRTALAVMLSVKKIVTVSPEDLRAAAKQLPMAACIGVVWSAALTGSLVASNDDIDQLRHGRKPSQQVCRIYRVGSRKSENNA